MLRSERKDREMARPRLGVNNSGSVGMKPRKAGKKPSSYEASIDIRKSLRDYDESRTRPRESKPPTA